MRRLLYCLSAILLLSSCETVFDINPQTSPKLYLQCFAGAGDVNVIQLFRTYPVGETPDTENAFFLEDAEIELMIDGTRKEVHYASEANGIVPAGCWYVNGTVGSGAEVEIKATYGDIPQIKASTVVPEKFPPCNISLSDGFVSVTLNDMESCTDFYGLAVEGEARALDDSGLMIPFDCMSISDDVELWGTGTAREYVDLNFNGWATYAGYGNLRLWSDKSFNGQTKTLAFRWSSMLFPGHLEGHEWDIFYRVRLYKVSPEFWNYALSRDNIANNHLAYIGLAPSSNSYSNVKGGLGVLGSYSLRVSGWQELE